jgi:hypothetical protein
MIGRGVLKSLLSAAVVAGALAGSGAANAATLINAFDLGLIATPPADYNGAGTQINFPGNAQGDAHIFLALAAGDYILNVSGATNANSRFVITFDGVTIAAQADLGGNGTDIQSFPFTLGGALSANLLFTPLIISGSNFEGHLDALEAAITPLPATLLLFATGLAGLGWMGARRRRQIVLRVGRSKPVTC